MPAGAATEVTLSRTLTSPRMAPVNRALSSVTKLMMTSPRISLSLSPYSPLTTTAPPSRAMSSPPRKLPLVNEVSEAPAWMVPVPRICPSSRLVMFSSTTMSESPRRLASTRMSPAEAPSVETTSKSVSVLSPLAWTSRLEAPVVPFRITRLVAASKNALPGPVNRMKPSPELVEKLKFAPLVSCVPAVEVAISPLLTGRNGPPQASLPPAFEPASKRSL